MARILITGATGSLGRRLAIRALTAGHTVFGTHVRPRDRVSAGRHPSAADRGPTPDVVGQHVAAADRGPTPDVAGQHAAATDHLQATDHRLATDRLQHQGAERVREDTAADRRTTLVRLDVRDRDAVRDLVDALGVDVVIHTAAARNEWAPTADGAANVALACGSRIRLVHVSSDALFSGRAGREYTERDEPEPVYPYGAAKAAAETAVRAIAPWAAIVRTSLILGDADAGHERLTHDLAAGRIDGALYTDEIRKPVHVDDLADALLELAGGNHRGVLNVAGADAVSRYELGVLVARRDGLDASRLRSASSSGRPGDVRLDIGLATGLLGTRLRGAHEFMRAANPCEG